jgi:hypothetical protein
MKNLEIAITYQAPSDLLKLNGVEYMGVRLAPPPSILTELKSGDHGNFIAVANAVLLVAQATESFAFAQFGRHTIDISKQPQNNRDWENTPYYVLRHGSRKTEADWQDYINIIEKVLPTVMIQMP